MPSSAQVASSWLVIWKQPSPSIAQTVLSGRADLGSHRGRDGVPHGAEAAGVEPVPGLLVTAGSARPTSGAGRRPRCRRRPGRRSCRSARSRTAGTGRRPRARRTRAGTSRRTDSSWWRQASYDGVRPELAISVRSAAIRSVMTSLQSPTIGTSAARFLRDLGRVDVGVDHLRVGGERVELAGHPVVEAGAEADEQVGALQGADRGDRAVHPGHAEVQVVRVRAARRGPSAW